MIEQLSNSAEKFHDEQTSIEELQNIDKSSEGINRSYVDN
jgi:hypothetical protein